MRNESTGTGYNVCAQLPYSPYRWPFHNKQLPGMSVQRHDEAKQRYARARVLPLVFI